MERTIKLEELGMFGLSIALFTLLDVAWWVFPALLLAPDLGMVGYLAGPKVGAVLYNLLHHKGIAVGIGLVGIAVGSTPLLVASLVLFGHSSMDRMFGYGLKFRDDFHHTHLGWIGRGKPDRPAE